MVSTILLDEQLDGFLRYFEFLTHNNTWREIAEGMGLRFVQLRDVSLEKGTSDRDIWQFCQANGVYLLTDNREQTTPESLGVIMATESSPESLPVFTIGDMDRLRNERGYGDAVAKSLLEYLFDQEKIRGTERLYLP